MIDAIHLINDVYWRGRTEGFITSAMARITLKETVVELSDDEHTIIVPLSNVRSLRSLAAQKNACGSCEFVSPTPAGLAAHRRAKHA